MTFFLSLWFVFIMIIFCILGILLSNIEVEVNNLELELDKNEFLCTKVKKANININVYFLRFIKILKIKINEKYLSIFGIKIKLKELYEKYINKKILKKDFNKIKDNYKEIDFKLLKPNLNKFKFKLEVGTENAIFTSFLTFIISSVLTYILKKSINTFDSKKYNYKIMPMYSNENYYYASLKTNIKFETLKIIAFAKQFENLKDTKISLTKERLQNKYKEYGIIR